MSEKKTLADIVISYLPEIGLAIATLSTGVFLILDDAKDFGKTDRFWHHVYTGLIPLIGGLAGLAYVTNKIMLEYYNIQPNEFKNKPPPLKNIMEYAPELLQLLR